MDPLVVVCLPTRLISPPPPAEERKRDQEDQTFLPAPCKSRQPHPRKQGNTTMYDHAARAMDNVDPRRADTITCRKLRGRDATQSNTYIEGRQTSRRTMFRLVTQLRSPKNRRVASNGTNTRTDAAANEGELRQVAATAT